VVAVANLHRAVSFKLQNLMLQEVSV
jgi:hypothetical protein